MEFGVFILSASRASLSPEGKEGPLGILGEWPSKAEIVLEEGFAHNPARKSYIPDLAAAIDAKSPAVSEESFRWFAF